MAKNITASFTKPVTIHIHSVRKRLADADGISAKAVIDGIVRHKILIDDSPQYVTAVTFTQEKGTPERTTMSIYEEEEVIEEIPK